MTKIYLPVFVHLCNNLAVVWNLHQKKTENNQCVTD